MKKSKKLCNASSKTALSAKGTKNQDEQEIEAETDKGSKYK